MKSASLYYSPKLSIGSGLEAINGDNLVIFDYRCEFPRINSVIDLVNARRMTENARRIDSEFGVTPLLPLLEKS
jgi:hypothetical protein